jgi:hypothetical protein
MSALPPHGLETLVTYLGISPSTYIPVVFR